MYSCIAPHEHNHYYHCFMTFYRSKATAIVHKIAPEFRRLHKPTEPWHGRFKLRGRYPASFFFCYVPLTRIVWNEKIQFQTDVRTHNSIILRLMCQSVCQARSHFGLCSNEYGALNKLTLIRYIRDGRGDIITCAHAGGSRWMICIEMQYFIERLSVMGVRHISG